MVGDERPESPAVQDMDSTEPDEIVARSPVSEGEESSTPSDDTTEDEGIPIRVVVEGEDDDGEAPGEPESQPEADPLAELQAKYDKTQAQMLRIAADYDNYKKRSRRDQQEAAFRARNEVLQELLPVVDNLERALDMATKDEAGDSQKSLVEGIEMVQRQFATAMAKFDVRSFESKGETFDPNFHEAIMQQESEEHPPGSVIEEYRKGYLMGDRLIRAAMVVVAIPPAASGEDPPAETSPEVTDAEAD